ncbi:MAG: hypothetical protein AVDCRST_MAG49-784, partial [uncultured Thermomicrobiales bacterium]
APLPVGGGRRPLVRAPRAGPRRGPLARPDLGPRPGLVPRPPRPVVPWSFGRRGGRDLPRSGPHWPVLVAVRRGRV